MFDDIIIPKDIFKKVNLEIYNNEAICPNCGSTSIKERKSGIFKPGLVFHNFVICEDCGEEWIEVLNTDTKIIEIRK